MPSSRCQGKRFDRKTAAAYRRRRHKECAETEGAWSPVAHHEGRRTFDEYPSVADIADL